MNFFYFPIKFNTFNIFFLFIIMFLTISSFGQTFLNIGFSFFISLIFIFIFIMKMKYLSKHILIVYSLLVLYTLIMSLNGLDLYHYVIAIFSLSSFSILIKMRLDRITILTNLYLVIILSIIILVGYNNKLILMNWNPNTISGLSLYGNLFIIIVFILHKGLFLRLWLIPLFLFYSYHLLQTDSRNSFLVLIVFSASLFFLHLLNNSDLAFWFYATLSLSISSVIPMISNIINNASYMAWFRNISYDIFNKTTIFSNRDDIWILSKQLVGDKWIFGTGESLYNYFYSHNMFYSVIYMYGVVGFLMYIILNLFIIYEIRKYSKKDLICMVLMLAYLANMWGQIAENRLFTSDLSMFFPYVILSISYARSLYLKNGMKLDRKYKPMYLYK